MINLKGYIFSKEFQNERAPQNIQNLVLRDYCKKNNYNFILSSTEYIFAENALVLSSLISDLKKIDGIIFYSIFQLPENQKLREKIIKKVISKKKQMHFVLESFILKDKIDINYLDTIWKLKTSLKQLDKVDYIQLKKFIYA